MSSEAAQKAFPDIPGLEGLGDSIRAAFDRGAVEALRQAAEEFDGSHFYTYADGSQGHYLQLHQVDAVVRRLQTLADEWGRGDEHTR